jgi:hypothetical protein
MNYFPSKGLIILFKKRYKSTLIDYLMSCDIAIDIIQKIYEKYKDDSYMIQKIHQYITNQLPNIFDTMKITREENIKKIKDKTSDQDLFIQSFLNKHSYYYIQSTEKFFFYDGIHYYPYSEDEILYSISKEPGLISWKQKTRISILKRIKENSLLTTIPNSETIQFIIEKFFPIFFNSKTQIKYFLTILGDNILKKTSNFYFMNTKSKSFLRELNNYSQIYIGINLNQSFKYKYHEHEYNFCRLIQINDIIQMEHIWLPIINQYFLDIICVSTHYSTRFGSADNYLKTYSNDDSLIQYSFYLKDMTPELLIESFLNKYIQKVNNVSIINKPVIEWKNLQYLWKHFLDIEKLPAVIFQQNLKQLFLEKLGDNYDEITDSFINVFSKYNPKIQIFLQFWDETMIFDEDASELEIDEIILLYKKWCKDSNSLNIDDKQIISLIKHFYPNIEIEEEKFVYKIRSTLWDKSFDIKVFLNSFNLSNISVYDIYEKYCKEQQKNNNIIVNKYFFEKIFFELRDL